MCSSRWILAVLLAAASCTRGASAPSSSPPPPVRPAAVTTGPAVAKVMMWEGSPAIFAAGSQPLAPKEDLELQADDVLRTPAQSTLVLHLLKNDYVVKVDEELELPVKDLALLEAPRSPKTVAQQLSELQLAREISADRVTAYQNRRTAGEGSRARAASKKEAAPLPPSAPAPSTLEESKAAPLPAPAAAAPEPPSKGARIMKNEDVAFEAADLRKAPPREEAIGGELRRAPARGGVAAAEAELDTEKAPAAAADAPSGLAWELVRAEVITARKDPLPAELAEALGELATVEKCVQSAWAAAGLASHGNDSLLLRIRDAKVDRVRLGSGLPAPSCLSHLKGKAADVGGDGWIRIRIALER